MENVVEIYNTIVETDELVDMTEVRQYVEMIMPVLSKKAPSEFLRGLLGVIGNDDIIIVKQ